MFKQIYLARISNTSVLRLNHPERLNALDLSMWEELADTIEYLQRTRWLRCIVLCGAGGNFAAGADLGEFATKRATPAQAAEYGKVMDRALRAIRDCEAPTIAAVEGACIGGGLQVAMACDLRIGATGSRYGAPLAKIGAVMPFPEISYLAQLAGHASALELLLEGRIYDAAEAKEKGLVGRIVEEGKAVEEAIATAQRIEQGAPLSHRYHKKLVRRCLDPRPLTAEDYARALPSVPARIMPKAFAPSSKSASRCSKGDSHPLPCPPPSGLIPAPEGAGRGGGGRSCNLEIYAGTPLGSSLPLRYL